MSEAATTTSTVSLAIDGMTSRHCAARVEDALSAVPSVLSVEVRLDSDSASVELGDMVTEAVAIAAVEALLDAAAGAGFVAHLRGYVGPPVSDVAQPGASMAVPGGAAGRATGRLAGPVEDDAEAEGAPLPGSFAGRIGAEHDLGGDHRVGPGSAFPGPSGPPDALRTAMPTAAAGRRTRRVEASEIDVPTADGAPRPTGFGDADTRLNRHSVDADATLDDPLASSSSSTMAPRERPDVTADHRPDPSAFAARASGGQAMPSRTSAIPAQRPADRSPRRERETPPAFGARIEPGFSSDAAGTGSSDAPTRSAASALDASAPGASSLDASLDASSLDPSSSDPSSRDPFAAAPIADESPAAPRGEPRSLRGESRSGGRAPIEASRLPEPDSDGFEVDRGITIGALAASAAADRKARAAVAADGATGFDADPAFVREVRISIDEGPVDRVDAAAMAALAERAHSVEADDLTDPTLMEVPVTDSTPIAARGGGPAAPGWRTTAPATPRLVEPGRVALSGRHVVITCAVLTAVLLLPSLLTALGLPFALSASLQFSLATVVMLLAGGAVVRSSWQSLRRGRASVDLLAIAGSASAWLLSLWLWAEGSPAGSLYFGTAAAVATLALAGQYLIYRTRRKAQDALDRIAAAQPDEVTRIISVDDEDADAAATGHPGADPVLRGRPLREQRLAVDDLVGGEIIMIRPGERVPADSIVLNGDSHVDESALTGDPTPVFRGPDDAVFAGTVNGAGRLFARVERVGADTTLARVLTRIEDAEASQSTAERKVDRIIGWLVPAVFVVALLTAAFWLWQGAGAESALARAIAVLVVAFPCALGLAAPAALITGTRAAARSGILVRDAGVIEAMPRIRTVAFEQTGSLTEGRPGVREILPAPGIDRASLLAVTVAIEGPSAHPLADAVRRFAAGGDVSGLTDADGHVASDASAAAEPVLRVEAEDVRPIPGAGIEGRVRFPGAAYDEAVPVFIGSEALMLQQGVDLTPLADELELGRNEGWTVSLVAMARPDSEPMLLGALLFADTPRPGARGAVEALRRAGIAPVMLSPDPTNSARATGATLGIDETVGELEPPGVDGWIQRAREAGRGVAMVGDAIDDADTLGNADLGIAISTDAAGRDVAIDTAPVTLMRDDVRLVPAAFDIGRRTHGGLRQNLGWALVFNAIGIPLAAVGLLGPVAAVAAVGAGMVCVYGNTLRLGQWKPDRGVAPF